MEIFIDSANMIEIESWLEYGVIDGVTTNPTVLLKDKVYDIEKGVKEIAKMVFPRPVSVEVTTNNLDEMYMQAHNFATWSENIVIKIPVINEFGQPCLGVINKLTRAGIKVNVTGIMSFNQVALAAQAGGTYLSIFAGRVSDEGNDAVQLIERSVAFTERWDLGKVLVGSIRGTIDVQNALAAGAHIITVPPQFLIKMVDHKYTRETVKEFVANAQEAIVQIAKVSSQIVDVNITEKKEMTQ